MNQNIQLAKKYLPLLDEVYKNAAKTADLIGDSAVIREAQNVGEVNVAKLDMDGLGDFSRTSGYTSGGTSLTWETVKYDKERSQTLKIDRLDQSESMDIVFGKLAGEFLRTKVVPETDAGVIAKLASTDDISTKEETISTGEGAIAALRAATLKMDNDEVDTENRILYITNDMLGLIDDLDSYKSKNVMSRFSKIVAMPPTRMYEAITLNTGATSYGYAKAEDARDINFLVVDKNAVVADVRQYIKYFSPDEDQDGDSHIFKYRNYNLYGYVYENKVAGVYASFKPLATS